MDKMIAIVSSERDLLQLSKYRICPKRDTNTMFQDYPCHGSMFLYLPETYNLVNELIPRHGYTKRISIFLVDRTDKTPRRENLDLNDSSQRLLTSIIKKSGNSILLVNSEMISILEGICKIEGIEIAILEWSRGIPTLL